jgi:hypothetical protein
VDFSARTVQRRTREEVGDDYRRSTGECSVALVSATDGRSRPVAFDGRQLTASVRSTFERRRTAIPNSLPVALTTDFAAIPEKQAQWTGFLRKNRLTNAPRELAPVIERLAGFLGPILEAVRERRDPPARWPAGGPWQASESAARQRRKKLT